jgi:hypothetical protein
MTTPTSIGETRGSYARTVVVAATTSALIAVSSAWGVPARNPYSPMPIETFGSFNPPPFAAPLADEIVAAVTNLYRRLLDEQVELEPAARAVLFENLWSLY